MTMNWQEVIKQEIDAAWKDGWLKGMEQGKAEALSVEPQECNKNILDLSDGITKIFEPQGLISSTSMTVIVKQKKSQVEKAKEAIRADMKLEHTVEYRHALMNSLTIIDRFCRGEGDEK